MAVLVPIFIGIAHGIRLAGGLAWRLLLVGGTRIMIEHAGQYMAALALRLSYHLSQAGVVVQSIRYIHDKRILHVTIQQFGVRARETLNFSVKLVRNARDAVRPEHVTKWIQTEPGTRVGHAVVQAGRPVPVVGSQSQGFAVTVKQLNGATLRPDVLRALERAVEDVGVKGINGATMARVEQLVGRGSITAKNFMIK